VLLLAVVGAVSYLGWRQYVPGVRAVTQAPRVIGHNASFTVTLEAARGNVRRAEVRIVQGGKPITLAKSESTVGPRLQMPVIVESAALGLKEGGATLEVVASDDFWRPLRVKETALISQPITIDLTPPRVEILSSTRYVSPGGAVLIAFRAPDASRVDVSVGSRIFPSFAYGPADKGARVALIALPWDFTAGTPVAVTARDEANNVATRAVPAELKPRPFPRDTITLTDAFLQAKVPELLPQRAPSQPLIDGFLVINRDQRRQAEEEKIKIGARTAAAPLWEGPFTQPRNTKVLASQGSEHPRANGYRAVPGPASSGCPGTPPPAMRRSTRRERPPRVQFVASSPMAGNLTIPGHTFCGVVQAPGFPDPPRLAWLPHWRFRTARSSSTGARSQEGGRPMSVSSFLADLWQRGVVLRLSEDRNRILVPRRQLSPALRERLVHDKPEIVKLLTYVDEYRALIRNAFAIIVHHSSAWMALRELADDQARLTDELGPALTSAIRDGEARQWRQETGLCVVCGDDNDCDTCREAHKAGPHD